MTTFPLNIVFFTAQLSFILFSFSQNSPDDQKISRKLDDLSGKFSIVNDYLLLNIYTTQLWLSIFVKASHILRIIKYNCSLNTESRL